MQKQQKMRATAVTKRVACREMRRQNEGGSRSGVALILIVGLLALMMVMGVAFSVYMRTERVAAGNFKNDVKARQLLYAALNKALEDINASVGTNSYPSWDVTNSVGYGDALAMTNGTALGLLPKAVWTGATLRAQWLDVNQPGLDGRIAYLALNCSGLLDANHAGGLDRGIGINAQEIQLTNLAEVLDDMILTNKRVYQTQQELGAIGTNSGALRSLPASLITYSAFPTGSLLYVGGDVASLVSNMTSIVSSFTNSGFSSVQAGILFSNLVDYVDADSIPGNLGNTNSPGNPDGPSVEAVWMFNELALTNNVSFTWDNVASNYICTNRYTVIYECASPFRAPPASMYNLAFTTMITNRTLGMATNFVARYSGIPLPPSGGYCSYSRPITMVGRYYSSSLPLGVDTRVYVQAVVSNSAGVVVDRVSMPPVPPLRLSVPVNPATSNGLGGIALECDDPRLNHDGVRWQLTNATPGRVNNRTVQLMASGWTDGDLTTYVRNGPVQSAGELGLLSFGSAGETVRLYNHGTNANGSLHRVLDFFTADNPTNGMPRGKAHLGTHQRSVLVAAYDGMPIDAPGAATQLLSGGLLDTVVDSVLAVTATNRCPKLSDLGMVDWAAVYPAGSYPGSMDIDREAFVRNAAGLFAVRQNYYIILLYAQAAKSVVGMTDRSVLSGARALVEVWRDPVKNAEGRNPLVVRSFRILNE